MLDTRYTGNLQSCDERERECRRSKRRTHQMKPDFPSTIRQLIAKGDLSSALNMMANETDDPDLQNECVVLQSSLSRLEKDERRGVLATHEADVRRKRISYAVLDLLAAAGKRSWVGTQPRNSDIRQPLLRPRRPRIIFISYNHADREIARRAKQALAERSLAVHIDVEVMAPGENIRHFIERSIRDTDATLSIVSSKSLLSGWVLVESINTFHAETFTNKRFFAGYLDDAFFDPGFRLAATKQIDAKIKKIERLAARHAVEKIDTNDLNEEKSRFYELRSQLGTVLSRLKESLSLDLRGEHFDASMDRIAAEVAL